MITYFVLKDEGGKAAGCVRLENGKVRSTCPCTLLLEDDTALVLGDDETPLPARALGAAVLNGETLAAWGAVPGAKLTEGELLYRLKRGKPAPDPEPASASAPAEEPEPEPPVEPDRAPVSEPSPTPAPEPEPTTEPEEAPEPADTAWRAADFGLLVRHAGEAYESILHPPLPEAPEEEKETEKKPESDWFSETEGLLTRLRGRQ